MIRLLIVDDSPVAQEFLRHIFYSDPAIVVVGMAKNGQEAVEITAARHPDVITMDLHMPILDGLGATRKIMETCATPIVIVSGHPDVKEAALTFTLLDAGALAVVLRPPAVGNPGYESASRNLIETVKCMSEIKVVARPPRLGVAPVMASLPEKPENFHARDIRIVAIGASTGGPQALQTILSALPKDFPVPIMIVQHIAEGFASGFVDWLGTATGLPVHLAVSGGCPLPGHVYVSPESVHMGVRRGPQIILDNQPPEECLRPAISYLFRTLAQSMGPQAVGILLTGMGRDGSKELKLMKEAGAITIAQDKESSVVFGMPGEAIKLNAAKYILPPEDIAAFLTNLLKK
ncbi:MAG: chemotaxis-specific protein-glutamate methyltransferase CheB [Candidatus Riflebacteria bacterium]|nr:chemotaxis-specific protein-glutamate methyltransferase CheB [Candidatus Riflebacteria bacterium]